MPTNTQNHIWNCQILNCSQASESLKWVMLQGCSTLLGGEFIRVGNRPDALYAILTNLQ
jgi:hypothetical protein